MNKTYAYTIITVLLAVVCFLSFELYIARNEISSLHREIKLKDFNKLIDDEINKF